MTKNFSRTFTLIELLVVIAIIVILVSTGYSVYSRVLDIETMKFGPNTVVGSFQDTTSNPLGLKHWDPTQ